MPVEHDAEQVEHLALHPAGAGPHRGDRADGLVERQADLEPHPGAAVRRDEVIDHVEPRLALRVVVHRGDVGERVELEPRRLPQRLGGGQQVVGRGLRLNIRDEDIQEICAIVDHEKLDHKWLWEMVGATVREDVKEMTLFGDEELPPRRKPQFVAKPENLIEIPEPIEEEVADFDEELEGIEIRSGDYPDWEQVINAFDYRLETEISNVEIDRVVGTTLDGSGFLVIVDGPSGKAVVKAAEEIDDPVVLGDSLKNSMRNIASDLLANEGVGSHELGYVYNVLMDHVRRRLLEGNTVGTATIEQLRHAIICRHQVAANFRRTAGLIESIVRYKSGARHGNQ